MTKHTDVPRIPLQLSQGCVVASIQIDLTEEVLKQFQQDLLARLHDSGAKGLILDLSGVEVMDIEDFNAINHTLSMASILGAKTILTGFQPGVVSSLVDLNLELDHINATLNLDEAFKLIKNYFSAIENSFSVAEDLEKDTQQDLAENLAGILEDNESA